MKKMIILLLLPLTALVAIDFTMTKEGLFTQTTTESPAPGTVPEETSSYLEPVNLPGCDANNPEVQFIRNNSDWSKINSSSKRIFCVSPGDYTSLRQIKLTASGTADKRRYIILDNGNDIHPGKLDKSQLANYTLEFDGVDYWTVDRLSAFDVTYDHVLMIGQNSTHNILNRMYTTNTTNVIRIRDEAHYNTIQNSFFNGLSEVGNNSELGAILMEDWGTVNNIWGTKIINNEFINMNAVRLAATPTREHYFNNTVIDGNINEYNEDIRCDCAEPYALNPSGDCLLTEAFFVVLKAGSSNENEPILISNNIAYGAIQSRVTSMMGATGDLILAYKGVAYMHVFDNVFYDSQHGISIADSSDGEDWGTYRAKIYDNIIVNCGENGTSLRTHDAKEADTRNNLIINPKGDYWAKAYYTRADNFMGYNTVINPEGRTLKDSPSGPGLGLETNIVIHSTAKEAGYTKDFNFTTHRFTNNPKVITLPNVLRPN